MKKIGTIYFILVLSTSSIIAQSPFETGIRFEEGLNWQQLIAKAKADNKYIFVDCNTTWCLPCRKMEKEVFVQPCVGDYFNANFISVKAQMDSSKKDNALVQTWYSDARYLRETYQVSAYPTYLFFTPEGKLLDMKSGAFPANAFVDLAKTAIAPENNYYAQAEEFKKGKRDLTAMSFLARKALEMGDSSLSREAANAYVAALTKDKWLTKENIEFTQQFTKSTTEKGFRFFYQNADSINRIMQTPGYAEGVVTGMIYREIVSPKELQAKQTNTVPDWKRLEQQIRKKYNASYADRVVLSARTGWARSNKEYAEYTKCLAMQMDKGYIFLSPNNPIADLIWNNLAWEIFLYSQEPAELEKALDWSMQAIRIVPDPNSFDTYASLLYKLGKKDKAIIWQQTAIKLNPESAELKQKLEAMKKGEPIWPDLTLTQQPKKN